MIHPAEKWCLIFVLVLHFIKPVYAQQGPEAAVGTGRIRGQVIDQATQSPLLAANVIIEGSQLGAAADENGDFLIEQVPAGVYSLRFLMIGYETRVMAKVVVNPKRTTFVRAELRSTILETEGVVVTAGYFHEAKDAVVSNRSMDFEEIRSDPGSAEDVQRVVQALPSVASGSDQDNEIIVRGGMPGENLFVMDNIEIPNPNHFGYQGTTGGPINMVNTYFIRQVDFYAGAFPARYGDKASSVMDIKLRDGDRERHTGHFYLGMSGAGGMMEGPVAGGKGAWILSGRKSFLDLIISSIGLTAVPKYYNLQGKATYDFSKSNRLMINGIFGDDRITIEGEGEGGYSRGAENVRSKSHQYAFGATLRTLFGEKGLSNITLSQTLNHWNHYVYHDDGSPYYTNLSTEIERTLKTDVTLLAGRRLEWNIGASVKAIRFDHDEWAEADTIYFYNTQEEPHQKIGVFKTYAEWRRLESESTSKLAGYVQFKWTPFARLTLTAGVREDYMHFIRQSALDPRIGMSFSVSGNTNLNLAAGQHSQSPAYVALTSHEKNRELGYKRTQQVVLGVERLFREDMRGTLEIFYKDYRKVPVLISWTTPDPFDKSEGRLVDEGHGFAKGIEFFLQKKASDNWHFTLSYAYSIAKGFDPRFGVYFDWDYDYRHIFTLINGLRIDLHRRNWYKRLSSNTLYKVFAWIIPLADQVDVSIRWRYLGGRPYTRPSYYAYLHRWFTDESVPANDHRYQPYHRFDLRIDRRFMFEGRNIVTYFDLMNVYDRDNIWQYVYDDDGSIDEVLQFKVFPVVGLAIEF